MCFLQVSNLKKILQSMLEYYHDVRVTVLIHLFYYFKADRLIIVSSIQFCLFSLRLPCHLSIHPFFQVLGQQVSDEHLPDVSLIGEVGDVTELGRLVQLVLGCAVSCEKKQGKSNKSKGRNDDGSKYDVKRIYSIMGSNQVFNSSTEK